MRYNFIKNQRIRRKLVLPMVLALVISLLAIPAVAYLFVSDSLTNTLKPAGEVVPTVTNDYRVAVNDIKYTVYIRAAVTVNWANGKNIYGQAPVAGTDYTITFNTTGSDDEVDWFYEDGFYYYKKPVASGGQTSALISGFALTGTAPTDYTLTLNMVAQAIQAKGTTDVAGDMTKPGTPAVTDAWGIPIDSSGNLINPNS